MVFPMQKMHFVYVAMIVWMMRLFIVNTCWNMKLSNISQSFCGWTKVRRVLQRVTRGQTASLSRALNWAVKNSCAIWSLRLGGWDACGLVGKHHWELLKDVLYVKHYIRLYTMYNYIIILYDNYIHVFCFSSTWMVFHGGVTALACNTWWRHGLRNYFTDLYFDVYLYKVCECWCLIWFDMFNGLRYNSLSICGCDFSENASLVQSYTTRWQHRHSGLLASSLLCLCFVSKKRSCKSAGVLPSGFHW